jgi:hypothetical protein
MASVVAIILTAVAGAILVHDPEPRSRGHSY